MFKLFFVLTGVKYAKMITNVKKTKRDLERCVWCVCKDLRVVTEVVEVVVIVVVKVVCSVCKR